MTFTDPNDLLPALPAQLLLEWVAPKILLMGTEKTEGKIATNSTEQLFVTSVEGMPRVGVCPSISVPPDQFYPQPPPYQQKPVIAKGLPRPFFNELRSFAALIIWHGCC
jgi:hypothetical protein